MSTPKGPAIPEDTFRVEGHCCGIRFTGIADMQQGFSFQTTPEVRAYLASQGVVLPPPASPSDQGDVEGDQGTPE